VLNMLNIKMFYSTLILGVAIIAGSIGLANADTVTFESLYTGVRTNNIAIPGTYGGYIWDSAKVRGVTKDFYPGTGYEFGTSGNVSLTSKYNPVTKDAYDIVIKKANPFDVFTVDVTAAWNTNENVTVQTYRSGGLVSTYNFTTSYDSPTTWNVYSPGIDEMRFISAPEDGENAGLGGNGAYLAVDNLRLPEPSTYLILGIGLFGLVILKGRLNKKLAT